MRLGTIALWGDDLERFRAQLRLAEELGYDVIGIGDSPAAWHELVVSLTVAAQATERATLTPMVTSPYLRHPTVTAAALSSLQTLTGGRVACTVGAGGSAVGSIGHKAATQRELRAFVTALRAASLGEQALYDGATAAALQRAAPFAIRMSADGPKALRLAGAIADGVVTSVGHDLDRLDAKLQLVREGATEAGRDPDTIDVWGMSFVSIGSSRAAALRDISAFLASTGGMGLKAPHQRATIPPALLPAVEELERRYDVTQHVVPGGANAVLVEELGLLDFISGLNSTAGTPEEVQALARAYEERGISCLLAPLPGQAEPERLLRDLAGTLGPTAMR
jgi:alkanesulfonate monooxygenase SsuD/methylene tetrahydromethanopterin reductase-like flavin-dependent oxidoreductase (luciferase family)